MRAIDADLLLADISAAEENAGMGRIVANTLKRYVMRQPTLPQPSNEPLTCEGCYYIKNDDYSPCIWCIRSKENEDYYRRPPEEEA